MASEYRDGIYAVPEGNTIRTKHVGERVKTEGFVNTDWGYVCVYSDWNESGIKFTRLDFIYDGQMHYRNIDNYYQPRYLVTLAKRFAQEIAQEGMTDGD